MTDQTAPARAPDVTILGLDLGKRRDWTALAVVQQFWQPWTPPDDPEHPRLQTAYDVPFLDRVQGQSYELIADRVAGLKHRPEHRDSVVVIDETGVGTAVGDMLETRNLEPHRITITSGTQATQDGFRYSVPKRDLATTVAIMLESRRLRIAKALPLATVLTTELENFQVKINLSGHDSYGAAEDWRDGNHDDLVLAVALAVWMGERMAEAPAVAATPIHRARGVSKWDAAGRVPIGDGPGWRRGW